MCTGGVIESMQAERSAPGNERMIKTGNPQLEICEPFVVYNSCSQNRVFRQSRWPALGTSKLPLIIR